MTDRISDNPLDYIVPLNINKLEGRMMYIPGPKGFHRDFLIVTGSHSLLERWWSLAENYADYGSVTMPDLPGFGGMDSFETIGIKPSVDAYADYLAAFIKLRFNRKKISIVGVSYGFLIITRMLQKYPELTKKVEILISLGGFLHKDDFLYPSRTRRLYKYFAKFAAIKPIARIEKLCLVNTSVLNFMNRSIPEHKMLETKMTKAEKDAYILLEKRLWQVNDLRTHWLVLNESFKADLCNDRVNLTVTHIVPKSDPYLDNDIVREHMKIVFTGYKCYLTRSKTHLSSIIADKKHAGFMLPPALRNRLLKSK